MASSELVYSEKHRSALITRILGLLGVAMVIVALVAAAMSITGDRVGWSDAVFPLVIGLILAGSHWFLVPRDYNVYNDKVVITYGRPRVLPVPYGQVAGIDVLTHPLGTELRIRRTSRRNLLLQPFSPRQFHESLEDSLSKFRGGSEKVAPSTEQGPSSQR